MSDLNDITLGYAGAATRHTITADDVASFVSERYFRAEDREAVKPQLRDSLRILDYAFGIGSRIGFAEAFGKNPEFKAYLLRRMKGDPNGERKDD